MKRKSVLAVFMEDLENSRGLVGTGEDDDELGAPGYKADSAVADGTDDLVDLSKRTDAEGNTDSSEYHLFGDDIAGAKVAESAQYIKTKKDFRQAVNALFHNLAEISVLSFLKPNRYGKKEHKIMVESMFQSIVTSKKPVLWESLTTVTKTAIANKVAYFQEKRELILAKPTKRNAAIAERYLISTNTFLKEVADKFGAENPSEASMDNMGGTNSSAVSVAATFGAAMGALKSKLSQCNNSDDSAKANCQVSAYNESLGLVRGLAAICEDDECRAKVQRAVGRLEIMKANAEKASDELPDEVPTSGPNLQTIPNPGMSAPGDIQPSPAPPLPSPGMMSQAMPQSMPPQGMPGMDPTGGMPGPPQGMPRPPQGMPGMPSPDQGQYPPQLAQEFFDLSKAYERIKNIK